MSKEIKCDFCDNKVKNQYHGVVSGESRCIFQLEGKSYDTIITFVNHDGDRIDVDICDECFKNGLN